MHLARSVKALGMGDPGCPQRITRPSQIHLRHLVTMQVPLTQYEAVPY